jgi:hypothetical protein
VSDGGKTFERLAGNTLRGRIRRYEFWMRLFKVFELCEQFIVLPVAYFGLIKHVIKVVVLSNLVAQLLDSFL